MHRMWVLYVRAAHYYAAHVQHWFELASALVVVGFDVFGVFPSVYHEASLVHPFAASGFLGLMAAHWYARRRKG